MWLLGSLRTTWNYTSYSLADTLEATICIIPRLWNLLLTVIHFRVGITDFLNLKVLLLLSSLRIASSNLYISFSIGNLIRFIGALSEQVWTVVLLLSTHISLTHHSTVLRTFLGWSRALVLDSQLCYPRRIQVLLWDIFLHLSVLNHVALNHLVILFLVDRNRSLQ